MVASYRKIHLFDVDLGTAGGGVYQESKSIAPGKTVREVEDRLVRLVPEPFKKDAHHWLILHGRYTCVARRPKCGECVIEDLCEYRAKEFA